MLFAFEDFHDVIRLLEQHPEWRAELRRLVLSDEVLALPAIVTRLAQTQEQTQELLRTLAARVHDLAVRLEQLTARVDQLVVIQTRTEERLEGLEAGIARLAAEQRRTSQEQGTLSELVGARAETDAEIVLLAVLEQHGYRYWPTLARSPSTARWASRFRFGIPMVASSGPWYMPRPGSIGPMCAHGLGRSGAYSFGHASPRAWLPDRFFPMRSASVSTGMQKRRGCSPAWASSGLAVSGSRRALRSRERCTCLALRLPSPSARADGRRSELPPSSTFTLCPAFRAARGDDEAGVRAAIDPHTPVPSPATRGVPEGRGEGCGAGVGW